MLVAAACRVPTDATPAEPTVLGLFIGAVQVTRTSALGILPGGELHFNVRLRDDAGRAVTGLHTNIVSRNVRALTIDSLGVVRVVGLGGSWIVGSVLTPARNILADSAFLNVLCTAEARPAILLSVVDSVTGQSGPMRALRISIRDGTRRDTVFVSSIAVGAPVFTVPLAYERRGTYDLDVSAEGYTPWARVGVVVSGDLCHVATVVVTARLQLQP